MRKNMVKERLKRGEPSFGVGMLWPSPELVEMCGHLGFQWLWLDVEHGPFDLQLLSNVVRAAELSGMETIARVASTNNPADILKVLETGVTGIIYPHVTGKKDLEFVIDAVKYPPDGIRSAGYFRPTGWGPLAGSDYYNRSNQETMVIALIEEIEGIQNIDEILAVEELDAVVIGFGDLALTQGHPGNKNHPDVYNPGTAAQKKVLSSNKALQVTVQDGKEAGEWVKKGALMLRCSLQQVLAQTLDQWLSLAQSGGGRP